MARSVEARGGDADARETRAAAEERADPFGLDPEFRAEVLPAVEFLYRRYWRVTASGVENVPESGAAVLAANHSAAIPLDAFMIAAAIELEHPRPRPVRFLHAPFVGQLPVVGETFRRLGAVPASYRSAVELARRGELVGIFPEGVPGVAKGIRHRYELQRFRTGTARLALEEGVPVIPVAVVGAEEIYPVLGRWRVRLLERLWQVPYVPVTPLFPLLGPLGLLPLPTRWWIRFGEPVDLTRATRGRGKPSRAAVESSSRYLRRIVQGMVHQLLAERCSLF